MINAQTDGLRALRGVLCTPGDVSRGQGDVLLALGEQ